MKTGTETPLRQLSEQIWRRRFGDCTIELSWDEWLEMSQEMGRAVLAEAERALRERAASPKSDFSAEQGLTEAADLLAGMRGT